MGNRVTQRILSCDICDKTPEDGQHLWNMCHEVWCESCCDKVEKETETENETEEA